jgi:hypothetical protein
MYDGTANRTVRQVCTNCFHNRPSIAFIDSSGICVCCLVVRAKAAPIFQQLSDREREIVKSKITGGKRRAEVMRRKGTQKRGQGISGLVVRDGS